ncbi:MAG: hypothetical protein AAGF90_19835, partial [Pseudomonadota bacterium]
VVFANRRSAIRRAHVKYPRIRFINKLVRTARFRARSADEGSVRRSTDFAAPSGKREKRQRIDSVEDACACETAAYESAISLTRIERLPAAACQNPPQDRLRRLACLHCFNVATNDFVPAFPKNFLNSKAERDRVSAVRRSIGATP